MELHPKLEINLRTELRAWLHENHDKGGHIFVPVLSRDPEELSYLAIVEECLCFGWIDSTKKKEGDTMWQRISPRRKNGNWTELNKERVRRLERLGLMTPAGMTVLPNMDVASFVIREDIWLIIRTDTELLANFESLPALYHRVRIDNIQSVFSDKDTYEKRLAKFVEQTKLGKLFGDWNDKGRLSIENHR